MTGSAAVHGELLRRDGTRQPPPVAVAFRNPDAVEIFQHLDGEVAPDAADAIEIRGCESAIGGLRGKMAGHLLQFFERFRQVEPIGRHAVNPAELLGAGEVGFDRLQGEARQFGEFAHPRRAHAAARERGFHALPQAELRRSGLHPVRR